MWTAVMLSCLSLLTMSMAACMAAQGELSSRSAFTFMPPVTRARVSRPVRSVTWMNVSFQVARMWQTAKTSPEVFCGPRERSCLASAASSAPYSPFPPFFFCSFTGAAFGSAALTSAIISNNILQIINILLLSPHLPLPNFPHLPCLLLHFLSPLCAVWCNNNQMISTRQSAVSLLRTLRYGKVSWTTGNPYNVRWQYRWRPAYYTYLRDGEEPTRVNKPEDSPAIRPPFYTYWQDLLYRVFPSLKTIYFRSERFQDPFQIFVLPSLSVFFYQFWDLTVGFKGLTILPWMLFWTRIRDRTLDPDLNEVHLRDIIHNNPELGALFKPETIHLLDYDLEYDTGFPCEKKFPEFKNKFFRFFNNDTHMTTGFYKFGDLESGATMTLHVKTMPVHGEFRYQVGEPFYFYDLRAELVHNGQFKEIVLVDENTELKKKRPFLIII